MEFDEETRQLIARAVRDRRASLGLSQEQAALASGGMISTANLRIFEGTGRPTFRSKSIIGVARALSWPSDAISRIAAGVDPATLPTITADTDRPAVEATASAGGLELATAQQVADLQRQIDAQQRSLDEFGRRLAHLDGNEEGVPLLTAANSGPDIAVPEGPRTASRRRVESFDPGTDPDPDLGSGEGA